MMQKITRTDLVEASVLQQEALRAIENGNYDAAFQLAGAIDQVFYRKGIDLVVAADFHQGMDDLYRLHNGRQKKDPWCRHHSYAWEMGK